MANNAPVEKFRIGTVQASVFQNTGKNGAFPSTTIENSFKKDGEDWKETNSYSTIELAALRTTIDDALKVHYQIEREARAANAQENAAEAA